MQNKGHKKLGKGNRPLSPHLGIYKPQISSVLSITHRLAGLYLFACIVVFSWSFLFVALAKYYSFEIDINWVFYTFIFKCILFGLVTACYYHSFNGIRHLIWDMGYGFEIRTMVFSGIAVVVLTIVCVLFTLKIIL